MNITLVRAVDYLFFLPYRVLSSLYQVFSVNSKNHSQDAPTLVIKLMGLGSLTFFTACCEQQQVDKKNVILLTFHSNRELCAMMGFPNCVFIRHSNFFVFTFDCLQFIFSANRYKIQSIVDFERCSYAVGFFRMVVACIVSADVVCFEDRKSNSISKRISAYSIKQLNTKTMFLTGIERLPKELAEHKPTTVQVDERRILVNCNASNYMLGRRYPTDKLINALTKIHERQTEIEFLFSGSKAERTYVNEIVTRLKSMNIPARNMAGVYDLQNFSNALATSKIFITCDSFPLHLAAYMNVPTIVVWGPTQPQQFGYEQNPTMKHVSMRLDCSPCLLHLHSAVAHKCGGKITCMYDLAPSAIVKESFRLLEMQTESRLVNFPVHCRQS